MQGAVSNDDLLSQLDELYSVSDSDVSVDDLDSDHVDVPPVNDLMQFAGINVPPVNDVPPVIDVPPVNDPSTLGDYSLPSHMDNYELIKKGIELRNIKLNNDLEVNTKLRELIRKMKEDIFEDQKRLMDLMASNVQTLRSLNIVD